MVVNKRTRLVSIDWTVLQRMDWFPNFVDWFANFVDWFANFVDWFANFVDWFPNFVDWSQKEWTGFQTL